MTTYPESIPVVEPRDLDPATQAQRRASDPTRSVWVNASAGTGKTKVLIERVLRLLLPRANGAPGSAPHRILCLTYTRAAATEMMERLIARVGHWAICDDQTLDEQLSDLLGHFPSSKHQQFARTLFARLVDGPEKVRLMTIHSFCQSVLSRFPHEAGVPSHFDLLDDNQAKELLSSARDRVMMQDSFDPTLAQAISYLSTELSDEQFDSLMNVILAERQQLYRAFLGQDMTTQEKMFRSILGLSATMTKDRWAADVQDLSQIMGPDLNRLANALSCGIAAEKTMADSIQSWLAAAEKPTHFKTLASAFIKETGERYSTAQQGQRKKEPWISELYSQCGDAVERLLFIDKNLDLLHSNMALFNVANCIIQEFETMKRRRGQLDFDDLIRATARLIGQESQAMSWVMYKLDGGIDHILVDEAQDTNPDQWEIITALAKAAQSQDDPDRTQTLFVVGDPKQSIYRFQGAEPEAFDAIYNAWGTSNTQTKQKLLDRVPMVTSFRSGQAVLSIVDAVFADPNTYQALRLNTPPAHVVRRLGQASQVELWPTIQPETDIDSSIIPPWHVATTPQPIQNPYASLAQRVAKHIRSILDQKEYLPSHNRPIEPGDIMILVRNRAPLMPLIRGALRAHDVPVYSGDRAIITQALAAQDILSALRFCTLPEDDLNFACLLKTPFIDLDDRDLLSFLPERQKGQSAYAAFLAMEGYPHIKDYLEFLRSLYVPTQPFHMVCQILASACPAQPEGSARAAIAARLGADAHMVLDDVLSYALDLQMSGQGVLSMLNTLDHNPPELNRLPTSEGKSVRILTVHGSKGLEAPIVILPDTIGGGKKNSDLSIFWPDDTGLALPIWAPRVADRSPQLKAVADTVTKADQAEDKRLLYVALTRAQDRLIVCGAQTRTDRPDDCWYNCVERAFDRVQVLPHYTTKESDFGIIRIYETPGSVPGDRVHKTANLSPLTPETLDWEAIPPITKQEQSLPKLKLTTTATKQSARSPLHAAENPTRFLRGTLTHKLLQILPTLPKDRWQAAGEAFLANQSGGLPLGTGPDILSEVMAILTNPGFAPLFGPNSQAEVPIAGTVDDGRMISGQMDRVYITDDSVWIVDYKTNRPPPRTASDVPEAYHKQLSTYRALLRFVYPAHTIRTFLLWTDGPLMMEIFDQKGG